MSKFLKALERAEHERVADPAVNGTTDRPGTAATAVPDAAPATVPAPHNGGVALADGPRLPAYGATLARHSDTAHETAFSTLLEPAPVGASGKIDDHLVSLLEPASAAAEQYRSVRLAIETFRRERGTRLVAVSSPGRGDGKTVTAINLAGSLAQGQGVRVALVEADLRRPSMAEMLGLYGGNGLTSYLLDPAREVDQLVQHVPGLGFAVVVAGAVAAMPYELLKSPRLGALFTTLLADYDFVVIDTPSALAYPDVGILRDIVDGFVLVVRANRTPRGQVHQSIGKIGPDRVLGMIFNADDRMGVTSAGRSPRRSLRDFLERPFGGARAA